MSTDYQGQTQTAISNQSGSASPRMTIPRGTTADTDRADPASSMNLRHIHDTSLAGILDKTFDSLIKRIPTVDVDGMFIEGAGFTWFERLHVFPVRIDLGNMLSTVVRDIEIYNSFRGLSQTLDTAVPNAGTGVSFANLPSLPATIQPNDGLIFQVRVSQSGQPDIDGTLDFTTSVTPLSIPITGSRVVMLSYEPEGPIQESLEFMTDVMMSANGKEQRVRVRNYPRQTIDYNFKVPEGDERRRMETFLYKWHPQVFGIPVWFEAQGLTAPVITGATTISLNTAYSDFREGGLLIVWQDYLTFDALEIDTISANSITLTSELTHNYSARTKVMPLRVAITKQEISGDKFPINMATMAIKYLVVDNEVDIGDTSAFSSHNSKVMFDDLNWLPRALNTDTLHNRIHRIDNNIGNPIQFSDWVNSTIITSKGFFCRNPQATWEMRQVLHALAGKQKSFYLPTFYHDVVPNAEMVSGTSSMDIDAIGYVDFIKGAEPNKSLYIVLTDGTIITRQVIDYSVIDDTTERLELDGNWPYNILPSEVRRVSFLRLGRFDNDRFNINHNNSGQATLKATVKGVLQ